MDLHIPDEARGGTPVARVRYATDAIERLAATSGEFGRLRREAIQEMLDAGMSKSQVAREVDLDPSRITRIVGSGPPPERGLLSVDGGAVTVALGSKVSEVGGAPSDMISRDAAEAFDTLRSAIEGHDLRCSREVVPAPGLLDLNRSNLIVLGSPKVLPVVGQILASDTRLGFGEDNHGRHLIDRTTGTIFRSPQDNGEPGDYAYLGRLNRPDGQGTFLSLAGIHAAGTHGAARYLVEHLPELYRRTRGKPFSLLVRTHYDGDSRDRAITSTEAVTDVHMR